MPSCLFDRVNRDDVGMVQRGDRPRFAGETLPVFAAGDGAGWKDFQGDGTVEFAVFRDVDLAHPAFAKQSDDAIVVER